MIRTGRPRMDKDERKSEKIIVPVTPTFYNQLDEFVLRKETTFAEFGRKALEKHLEEVNK